LGLFFALKSNAVWTVYVDITMLAVLIMPTLPLLMDLSCDMVAPIEPSFAVGALYMGSMAFFVVFTYALTFVAGEDKDEGRVFLTIVSSVVALGFGFLCTLFVKMDGYEPVTVESERHSLVVPV
jgi:FLVCR family feline leukemia virus subgroup C receptor-related protein